MDRIREHYFLMAHFAQLNENNIVINVIVIHNNELLDENGNESEAKGIQFCKDHYGQDTVWVQTSYNGNIRKNYAGLNYTYDIGLDAFIPPRPFPSWILNDKTYSWDPPIPIPNDGFYHWDEETLSWIKDGDLPEI